MKKFVIYYVSFYLILVQAAMATGTIDPAPCLQNSWDGTTSYNRLCNNVEDIICKDVKTSERRSCNESKQDLFRTNLSINELGTFLKACFGAAFTSFKQFFTEFIPELLKGIWDLTKAAGETVANDVSGKGPSFWKKIKGQLESVSSVTADIYEAASSNPSAFIKKLMTKISDNLGPLVANFDCLKPELKVAKVCGFVGEWVVPPVMLAKMLVKGTKLLKGQAVLYGFSKNEAKMAQYAKAMEKMDVMSMKQMQFEEKYRALGYTKDEFEQIVKSGTLKNFDVENIKVATSKDGWQQRLVLLGKKEAKKTEVKAAVTTTASKTTDTPKASANKIPKLTSESFTITIKRNDGSTGSIPGKILEKIQADDGKTSYKIRVYDPKSGKMKEATLTEEAFAKLHPLNEDAVKVGNLMKEGYKKNPNFQQAATAAKNSEIVDSIRKEFGVPDKVELEVLSPNDPRFRNAVGDGKYEDGTDLVPDSMTKKLPAQD